MNKWLLLRSTVVLSILLISACSSDDNDNNAVTATDDTSNSSTDTVDGSSIDTMTFFLTSVGPGDGANLGGLPGADIHCTNLAEAAGRTNGEWRAYLSTTGADGINARDRIGDGPWTNANGIVVADSVDNLHSDTNNLTKETVLTENGSVVNGRGDTPNRHDILTGTELTGLASTNTGTDTTCANWTSNSTGSALVGHHDRVGGGPNPTSWSTAHGSSGCSQANLQALGGDGLFYCFATN